MIVATNVSGCNRLLQSVRGQGMRQIAAKGWFKSQNILCLLFLAPSVGATQSERVLLPRTRDALLGETFRGNRQSRVTLSRRAQGLTPKQSPIEAARKAGTDLRERYCRSDFKNWTERRNKPRISTIGRVRSTKWNDCVANSGA